MEVTPRQESWCGEKDRLYSSGTKGPEMKSSISPISNFQKVIQHTGILVQIIHPRREVNLKENEDRDPERFLQIKQLKFRCPYFVYNTQNEFFYSEVKLTVLFKYGASVINVKSLCGEPVSPEKGNITNSRGLVFGAYFILQFQRINICQQHNTKMQHQPLSNTYNRKYVFQKW